MPGVERKETSDAATHGRERRNKVQGTKSRTEQEATLSLYDTGSRELTPDLPRLGAQRQDYVKGKRSNGQEQAREMWLQGEKKRFFSYIEKGKWRFQ